jgi:hypothetical protein
MRVVSGARGAERMHFEVPPATRVEQEMETFLRWWENDSRAEDGLPRAALAHLWFVTLHPYEDGNGRLARVATGLVPRTTRDVDVVALMRDGALVSPAPLPDALLRAAREVAEDLGLDPDWLNNGPRPGEGGLFQMRLPEGFASRLQSQRYGDRLRVHFASRTDQIHFKLFASADRGGYHIDDLRALDPMPEEVLAAARWTMTHDVSEGYAMVLEHLLQSLGHGDLADQL